MTKVITKYTCGNAINALNGARIRTGRLANSGKNGRKNPRPEGNKRKVKR